jgi:protein-arginine kinase
VRIRLSRNIRPYPFVSILRRDSLIDIQSFLAKQIELRVPHWEVITLEGLEKEERDELVEARGLWIPEVS